MSANTIRRIIAAHLIACLGIGGLPAYADHQQHAHANRSGSLRVQNRGDGIIDGSTDP